MPSFVAPWIAEHICTVSCLLFVAVLGAIPSSDDERDLALLVCGYKSNITM